MRAHERLQYTLIKEYTLNHIRDPTTIQGIFLEYKGYWSLWVFLRVHLTRLASMEPATGCGWLVDEPGLPGAESIAKNGAATLHAALV